MWPLFVSIRYLLAKRREKFISIISFISVLGVAVGVAALIVVISVMTGFDEEIKERIIGTYAHLVVMGRPAISDTESIINKVKTDKDIIGASSFIERQALLRSKDTITGILIRGVDEVNEPTVSNIKHFTSKGVLDFGKNNIILGSELRKNLNISIGDEVSLISPEENSVQDFVVSDTFSSGRYDYDANIACISLEKAKTLFNTTSVTGLGLKVKNEYDVRKIKKRLQKFLGYTYSIRTWMDLDRNLMKALAMEKKIMFIILGLIVIVACLNICSSLIMMVMEKTKDIGILRSIGATSFHVGLIFLLEGLFIGLLGTTIGAIFGVTIAKNINPLAGAIEKVTGSELFPSDIYYLASIPAKIDIFDISLILGFAIIIATVSGLYPAYQAARMEPVEAIKYE